jgi:hypothetical protein
LIMILVTLGSREKPGERKGSLILRMAGERKQRGTWHLVNVLVSVLIALTIIGLWAHFS